MEKGENIKVKVCWERLSKWDQWGIHWEKRPAKMNSQRNEGKNEYFIEYNADYIFFIWKYLLLFLELRKVK